MPRMVGVGPDTRLFPRAPRPNLPYRSIMGSRADSRRREAERRKDWGRFFLAVAGALASLVVVWLTVGIASSGVWMQVMLAIFGPWDLLALCVAVGTVTYLVSSHRARMAAPSQPPPA